MAIRFITNIGADNTNIDGAVFNNFSASGASGIIAGRYNECQCVITASNVLSMQTGELLILGQRWVFDTEQSFTFSNIPAKVVNFELVAEISLSNSILVPRLFVRETQNVIAENLYKTDSGTYQLVICQFIQNRDGTLTDLIMIADKLNGKNSGGGGFVVGKITTSALPVGADAIVDISPRTLPNGDIVQDFTFGIPLADRGTKVYVGGVLRSEVRVFRQEGKPGDAEWGVGDVWERIVGRVE